MFIFLVDRKFLRPRDLFDSKRLAEQSAAREMHAHAIECWASMKSDGQQSSKHMLCDLMLCGAARNEGTGDWEANSFSFCFRFSPLITFS